MIDLKNRGMKNQSAKKARLPVKRKEIKKWSDGLQARKSNRRSDLGKSSLSMLAGSISKWFVRGGLLAIGGGLVFGAVYLGHGLYDQARARPLNNIGIEGSFNYVSKQDISDLVSPFVVEGFLKAPISDIKSRLENEPWIETALVSRRWPDTLYISVIEQQPIARWSDYGFVNHHGDVINIGRNEFLVDLPLLQGGEELSLKMMNDYQQLTQQLRPYKLAIRELLCDDLMSWRVVLSNGIEITLGRDEIMEKMRRFLLVYNTSLRAQVENIASIDLRYGNGVAVKWKLEAAVEAEATHSGQV
ncbi:hypothetical protein NBRC116494_13440 [Aurantivibrio plasticivorans]